MVVLVCVYNTVWQSGVFATPGLAQVHFWLWGVVLCRAQCSRGGYISALHFYMPSHGGQEAEDCSCCLPVWSCFHGKACTVLARAPVFMVASCAERRFSRPAASFWGLQLLKRIAGGWGCTRKGSCI